MLVTNASVGSWVTTTVAEPRTLPVTVYAPAGRNGRCGGKGVTPGVNGVPHGTASEIGAGGAAVLPCSVGNRAIITRLLRPPGSVESVHSCGDGLAPHARFSAQTTAVLSASQTGSAAAFQFGSPPAFTCSLL